MDVVVHQYEGMGSDAMGSASFAQQTAEVVAVLIIEEDGGAMDTTLGDLEGNVGEYESGATRHIETASYGLVRACPWSSVSRISEDNGGV